MTQLKVDTITDAAGTAAPDLEDGLTVNGSALSTVNTAEYYSSGTEPSSPKDGAIWWDTANDKVMIYVNDEFREIELGAAAASFAWGGDKGHYLRDTDFANTFSISTPANATSVSITRSFSQTHSTAAGNVTKLVYAGGSTHDDCLVVTSATSAVASVTSALTFAHIRYHESCSNGTYMTIMAGRTYAANPDNQTQYLTIDSFSSATNGGDLTVARTYPACVGDATYGVCAGGYASATLDTIDYVTVATTTAASDFGDLTTGHRSFAGADDATRGLFAGGIQSDMGSYGNTIEYITTATPSNGTDFGDLTVSRYACRGCSDGTYAVFVVGYAQGFAADTMDYVTIQTTGNATDFGDITNNIEQYGQVASGAAS